MLLLQSLRPKRKKRKKRSQGKGRRLRLQPNGQHLHGPARGRDLAMPTCQRGGPREGPSPPPKSPPPNAGPKRPLIASPCQANVRDAPHRSQQKRRSIRGRRRTGIRVMRARAHLRGRTQMRRVRRTRMQRLKLTCRVRRHHSRELIISQLIGLIPIFFDSFPFSSGANGAPAAAVIEPITVTGVQAEAPA